MAIFPHGYAGALAPYFYHELEGNPLEKTHAIGRLHRDDRPIILLEC